MSRFAALDLGSLPAPSALVDLDYDAILAARLDALELLLADVFEQDRVADIMGLARNLPASPTRYLTEAAAAREFYLLNALNEALRGVFLATAQAGDLDQHGASRGVVRRVLDDSDSNNRVMEADPEFRARIQLELEARSPHGQAGSYVFWALDADPLVADVVVYGPDDPVAPPVPAAEPRMLILSRDGDGVAAPALLEAVRAHCMSDQRRPVGDRLEVVAANPVPFKIEAVLHVVSASAAAAVEDLARTSLNAFLTDHRRIAKPLYQSSLCAALAVTGVRDVQLIAPVSDVPVGPFDFAQVSDILLTVTVAGAGWRDV